MDQCTSLVYVRSDFIAYNKTATIFLCFRIDRSGRKRSLCPVCLFPSLSRKNYFFTHVYSLWLIFSVVPRTRSSVNVKVKYQGSIFFFKWPFLDGLDTDIN